MKIKIKLKLVIKRYYHPWIGEQGSHPTHICEKKKEERESDMKQKKRHRHEGEKELEDANDGVQRSRIAKKAKKDNESKLIQGSRSHLG